MEPDVSPLSAGFIGNGIGATITSHPRRVARTFWIASISTGIHMYKDDHVFSLQSFINVFYSVIFTLSTSLEKSANSKSMYYSKLPQKIILLLAYIEVL